MFMLYRWWVAVPDFLICPWNFTFPQYSIGVPRTTQSNCVRFHWINMHENSIKCCLTCSLLCLISDMSDKSESLKQQNCWLWEKGTQRFWSIHYRATNEGWWFEENSNADSPLSEYKQSNRCGENTRPENVWTPDGTKNDNIKATYGDREKEMHLH